MSDHRADQDVNEKYDVFLCYTWADKQWCGELLRALNKLGLNVFHDDEKVEEGDELAPRLREAIDAARTLVVLYTPNFPRSPHCRAEVHRALSAAYRLEKGSTTRIITVISKVRPSDVRPRQLAALKLWRGAAGVEELAERIARRVGKIRAADPRTFGAAPRYPQPGWFPMELPGDGSFHGRSAEMWELHEGLRAKSKDRDMGHPVVSVRGTGGQGKTALCLQYARFFPEDHPGGVFLVRLSGSDRRLPQDEASVRTSFNEQLARIGHSLGLAAQHGVRARPSAWLDVIRGRLRDRKLPYLWIVDDVPSSVDRRLLEELYAPTGDGKTLITTRGRFGRLVSEEMELGGLDGWAGLKLLTGRRPPPEGDRAERRAARSLPGLLGGHPLGLTLAAGLTTLPGFGGYAHLLGELDSTEPDVLELAAHLRNELPAGYALPFTAALLRSFQSLTEPGRELLAAAGVLGPDPIPLDLAAAIMDRVRPSAAAGAADGLRHAHSRGLAEVRGDMFQVHALTGRAVRVLAPGAARSRLRDAAVSALTDAVSGRDPIAHRSVVRLLPHVRAAIGMSPGMGEPDLGPDAWHLLTEEGRAYARLGDSRASLQAFHDLYEACASSPECDEASRLRMLGNLGSAYFHQGEYSAAEKAQAQALEAALALFGRRHHVPLTLMSNLANTHTALDRPLVARALLTTVYLTYRDRRDGGKTAPETLTALNNLVITVAQCGDDEPSRRFYRRVALQYARDAHGLWCRTRGPNAGGALDALNSIGGILLALGRATDAAKAFGEVWKRRSAVLGEDHPDTIDARQNMLVAREAEE